MGAESSSMQNASTACNGCKLNLAGNKTTDTVAVDMGKIFPMGGGSGKENLGPGQMKQSEAASKVPLQDQERLREKNREEEQARKKKEEEEHRRRKEEEEEKVRRQLEEEARLRKLEEETRRREEEEARIAEEQRKEHLREIAEQEVKEEARRLREQEEEWRKQVEEEEARQLQELQEEARRLREEQEAARQKRLQSFLEKTGFKSATEKKVRKGILSSGFLYPLHAAVEAKDAEAVSVLLRAGADRSLANSKKQTPLQLAQARNKQGSHALVIKALSA